MIALYRVRLEVTVPHLHTVALYAAAAVATFFIKLTRWREIKKKPKKKKEERQPPPPPVRRPKMVMGSRFISINEAVSCEERERERLDQSAAAEWQLFVGAAGVKEAVLSDSQ